MILVTGAKGQLGTEVCRFLDEMKIDYIGATRETLDVTNQSQVQDYVTQLQPSIIYHCAAYTAVDKAEDEGKEMNYLVNVEGTRNIALAAKAVDATLVYISTDYVFDGTSDTAYETDDQTNPQTEYGKAKLKGERIIQELLEKYYIIRTSWVFGEYGSNFVYTMQKLAETREILTIVNDQYGRPTWTRTLVEFMSFVIEKHAPYGIYHLSNEGRCTWYEFAKEILKENRELTILPVSSKEFPQKAKRPKNSVMNLKKSKELGFNIINWNDSLQKMLLERVNEV